MFSIKAIMSTDLITTPPSATLAEARAQMQENGIHHLPVTNDGALVGLVTITNVLAAADSILRDSRDRIHANEVIVSEIMVKDVATVDINASLRQAALFLEKHQIGCLPVTDGGDLIGIITDTDFVAVAINMLEQVESMEPLDDDFDDLGAA